MSEAVPISVIDADMTGRGIAQIAVTSGHLVHLIDPDCDQGISIGSHSAQLEHVALITNWSAPRRAQAAHIR